MCLSVLMVFAAAEVASSSAQPVLLLEVDSVFPDGFQVLHYCY